MEILLVVILKLKDLLIDYKMVFALVTTTQLIVVMEGVLTAHLIWNNPPDCPEEVKKLGYVEQREVCEYKFHGYGQWRWVLKE